MVMFSLVLATAAFVLAGAPQPCRCDRTPTDGSDLALRATLSSDNGLDGNIWRRIRERVLSGGGNNLISGAKLLTHDAPSTFHAWNRPGVNPSELTLLESLINRYRKYMVERVVRFDDACSLLFGGEPVDKDRDDDRGDDDNGEQVGDESRPEISRNRGRTDGLVDDSVGSSFKGRETDGGSGASNKLQRDGPIADTLLLRRPTLNDLCSNKPKQYYQCLLERFNDQQLIGMVQDYLESYCFRQDPFERSTAALQKRDTPRYVSKQKFHSWGGKRNTAQVFYPWGGKRTVPRAHKQPKVVIRNPFHSWGGKRGGMAVDSSSV